MAFLSVFFFFFNFLKEELEFDYNDASPPHPRQLLGMCLSSGSEALAQGRTREPAGCSAAIVVFRQGSSLRGSRAVLSSEYAGTGFWCCRLVTGKENQGCKMLVVVTQDCITLPQ